MAPRSVLLKDGIFTAVSDELHNAIGLEQLDVALGVEPVRAFEESRLSSANNPSPDHERSGKLLTLHVNVVALLHPPRDGSVGGSGETRLVCEDDLQPVLVLVCPAKSQPLVNVALAQKMSMSKRLVGEILVVSDLVDCRSACPEDVGKVRV